MPIISVLNLLFIVSY